MPDGRPNFSTVQIYGLIDLKVTDREFFVLFLFIMVTILVIALLIWTKHNTLID